MISLEQNQVPSVSSNNDNILRVQGHEGNVVEGEMGLPLLLEEEEQKVQDVS